MSDHNRVCDKTLKRWKILAGLVMIGLFFVACKPRPTPKIYRVGILNGFVPFSGVIDGFGAKMTELGYIEGQNIVYDLHQVQVGSSEEQQAIEQFVADQVDLILVFPTGSALAAKAATQGTNIPVVFALAGVEGTGLIESVRQPGGNITGVRAPGAEAVVKRFEFLLQVAPHSKRVYVTYNENYAANQPALQALRTAAYALGVTLVEAPVTSVEGIRADLDARAASSDIGLDAILISADDLSQSPAGWALISQFAQEQRVPIGGGASIQAETGAVFSYVTDYVESGKLAAISADKIIRGAPAGSIPVATPVLSLRINYKQAQELGLTVPKSLLNLATEIID